MKQFALGEDVPKAPFYDVALSPSMATIAAAGADKKVHLWTVTSGALARSIPRPPQPDIFNLPGDRARNSMIEFRSRCLMCPGNRELLEAAP